jgi:hypothetical protein
MCDFILFTVCNVQWVGTNTIPINWVTDWAIPD